MTVRALLDRALAATAVPPADALACLGADAAREMIAAAGFMPWRLSPDGRPGADFHPALGRRSRRVLASLLDEAFRPSGVVLTNGSAEDSHLFAVLRELDRTGRGPKAPFAFVDLLRGRDEAARRYNLARLDQFRTWLETLSGRPIADADMTASVKAATATRRRIAELFAARRGQEVLLSGSEALDLIGVVTRLSDAGANALLDEVGAALSTAPPLAGSRVILTGSAHESSTLYRALEALGAVVVGEDHAWGDPWVEAVLDETLPVAEAITERSRSAAWPSPRQSSQTRAQALAARAKAIKVDAVIHVGLKGDEAAPWDVKATRAALTKAGVPFLALANVQPEVALDSETTDRIQTFLRTGAAAAEMPKVAAARPTSPKPEARPEAKRSRKSLACTADFGAWQREWFAGVREAAANGPFAVVNADAPQEILRAMDIPYVVNQWWASIVAAKQKAGAYGRLLKANDYPSTVETYSAQGLAAALAGDDAQAPWGGLPTPSVLSLIANSDPGPKLFEAWAEETGADLFVFDRSIESRIDLPIAWWDDMPDRWAETLEPERLELMAAQIEGQIARLETLTGRTLDRARLVEVMTLVNEQEDYYRRTRDLIARTRPAPVGIVDTMPATMVPQWHRGTVWARDAARRFYEEVSQRAADGEAACPNERLRLMWVGRGLWSDTGFYQRWEESHGAVFVWSMYLGLAADGYLRSFEGEHDVIRALAARFVTMGDELRMPTWSGAWHVKEALTNGCHGAVAIDDADPLVLDALERAGVPVCRIALNNMGAGSDDLDRQIAEFLDGLTASRPDQATARP